MTRKRPEIMTASEINHALDRLDREDSTITDAFIAAGRGNEHPSEYLKKNDPLSLRALASYDRRYALRSEVQRRYGPGAPSRLPRGFGPRKDVFFCSDDKCRKCYGNPCVCDQRPTIY